MASLPDATLSEIPVDTPPPGISPNFVDPQTLAPAVVAVSIVMMTWALLFVIIRLYANFHAPRGLAIDDFFCIIATVLAVTYTGVVLSLKRFERHTYDVPLAWIDESYQQLNYVEDTLLSTTIFFAKSTILLLYLHIFTANRKMRYSIWFGLAWCSLYWAGIPIFTLFCAPRIGEPWNFDNNNCSKDTIYGVVQSVLSVPLDLYIFVLPIPIVLRLQMSLKRRLLILGIFGTAFLGITAAVVRMIYQIKLHTGDDPLWGAASTYICITCENYVAIIVGSMPAFASFFNGKMPGASWLASMKSLVLKSRNGASSSKSGLSHRSKTGIPSSGEFMIPGGHARDKSYLELGDYELGSVRTDIRGEGAAPTTLEEGVVHKTIAVHQSMRQERPTA